MKSLQAIPRFGFLCLGFLFLGLGYIGILVPGMPTTIFWILALACFSRSSEKMELFLLNHRLLGPTLRNWREHGTISKRTKVIICVVIGIGMIYTTLMIKKPMVLGFILATTGAVVVYILTRPSEPSQSKIATI